MSTHKVSMKGEHPPRFEDQIINKHQFTCNYCAFSSEYKYNLNQHLEKVHHIILTPTPPKLMHFDDQATWKTLPEVLQERDKVYIGPHRELLSGGNLPQTANNVHWNNTKLLHMLYRRKITVEKYVELYEEYAREKLWNHLEQLDAMTLVYGDKDGGRNQAIILRRLFVEKFFNKIE